MKNTFVLMTAILLTSTAAYAQEANITNDAVITSETVIATPDGAVVTTEPVITVDPTTAIQQNDTEDKILTESEIEPVETEAVEEEEATPAAEVVKEDAVQQTPANFRNPPPLVPLVSDPGVYQSAQSEYGTCLNKAVETYYNKKKSYRYKRNRMVANCRSDKYDFRNAVKQSFGTDADFGAANNATNKIVSDYENAVFSQITARIREKLAQEKASPQ